MLATTLVDDFAALRGATTSCLVEIERLDTDVAELFAVGSRAATTRIGDDSNIRTLWGAYVALHAELAEDLREGRRRPSWHAASHPCRRE